MKETILFVILALTIRAGALNKQPLSDFRYPVLHYMDNSRNGADPINLDDVGNSIVSGNSIGYYYDSVAAINDLLLVKPMINFNDTNGGYYSEYYESENNVLYCGGIVKNSGDVSANNVYVELDIIDYDGNLISTYNSDTLEILNPDSIATLKIPAFSLPPYFGGWYTNFIFKVKSDSADQNENDNIDTIPSAVFDNMWTKVSRANVSTGTLDMNRVENFQSEAFIGVTLRIPYDWPHQTAAIGFYLTEPWPDSLNITGEIYQNKELIFSVPIVKLNYNAPTWIYQDFDWGEAILEPGYLYYFGVKLTCPQGTPVPVGIDTSSFHNIGVETIAKIGNSWVSLYGVPLVQLICDPEDVPIINNSNVKLYPNPNSGKFTIASCNRLSSVEVYNLFGEQVYFTKVNLQAPIEIDLSSYGKGIYLIKIDNGRETQTEKIVIQQ